MSARLLIAAAVLSAALFAPAVAAAQSTIAYATAEDYSNLRAGPGTRYEVIARVYPGSEVEVLGCLDARNWCEVWVQDIRGWMSASRLEFVYSGRRVPVPDYYSYFDPPSVIFNFGDYSRHRDRDRRHGKRRFGHPGGGGPGPEYNDGNAAGPPEDSGFGHPGGGRPGPEEIIPPSATRGYNKERFGHPGGGAPGPETIVPLEGTTGVGPCAPDDPLCTQ
jgi:uncharacterized protein YraI